ncbi:hypothetical protein D3C77_627550 [compost metagenome]
MDLLVTDIDEGRLLGEDVYIKEIEQRLERIFDVDVKLTVHQVEPTVEVRDQC